MQKIVRFFAWSLIVLAALIGGLRATALRWWQVPADDLELSASLAPTLRGGDWVILWRLTKPGLGSLVRCPDPDDPKEVVVGRLVAREGQTVRIEGTDVAVDGKTPPIEYNCTEIKVEVTNPDSLKPVELSCDMEDIGGQLHKRAHGRLDSTPRTFEKPVGKDQIFLLSDNRVHPFDSRHFGTVPASSCRESVVFRLMSKGGFFDVDSRLNYIR